MLKRIALAIAIAATGLAQNQEAPKSPDKFYKLDFVVKEVEGVKVLNARAYSTTIAADTKDYASIRAGSRVAFPAGMPGGGKSQFTFMEIGVNIDCRSVREVQRGLSLSLTAGISSVPSEPAPDSGPPTLRQNKWTGSTVVPLKKPTLVFSSDDLMSKRQMQLEVTATPIM